MLATYAASRHRQIVPCCMISSVSHDNVSLLVTDRSMCFSTRLDKAFENIDCMSAILRCQAKNRFYESTQRLIQPRRVLCTRPTYTGKPRNHYYYRRRTFQARAGGAAMNPASPAVHTAPEFWHQPLRRRDQRRSQTLRVG